MASYVHTALDAPAPGGAQDVGYQDAIADQSFSLVLLHNPRLTTISIQDPGNPP